MKKKSTWQEAVELAFSSAQKRLRGLDPEAVAKRSASEWHQGEGGGHLELSFLSRRYRVDLPHAEVRAEAGEEPPLVRRVLILHYLIQAQGKELAGRWVDFRSLPGGVVYYPAFRGRVISRLVRMFGERPGDLIPAAAPLGGRAIEMADVAIEIPAFPRVPVVFALWEASDEFGPEGTVMYDDALPAYLETEDAIIVCEEILGALRHYVQRV
jgi:hypothetical protein